jgi:hypothetical protein
VTGTLEIILSKTANMFHLRVRFKFFHWHC